MTFEESDQKAAELSQKHVAEVAAQPWTDNEKQLVSVLTVQVGIKLMHLTNDQRILICRQLLEVAQFGKDHDV